MGNKFDKTVVTFNGTPAITALKAVSEKTAELKKVVDELRLAGQENTAEFRKANREYEQHAATTKKMEDQYKTVAETLENLSGATVGKLNKTMTSLKNSLRGAVGRDQAKGIQDSMASVQDALDKTMGKYVDLDGVMKNLGDQSENTLRLAIEKAKLLRNEAVVGSDSWKIYGENIRAIEERLVNIAAIKVQPVTSSGSTGQYSKDEITQAIAALEKLKSTLKLDEQSSIDSVEKKIQILNRALLNSAESGVKLDDVLASVSANKKEGKSIDYSITQLSQALEVLNKKISTTEVSDPGFNKMKLQADDLTAAINRSKRGIVNIEDVVKKLDTQPLNVLKQAAEQLKEEIAGATRNTDEYIEKSRQYEQVKEQLEKVTREIEGQDGKMTGLIKRALTYMGVYSATGIIVGKLKEMVSENVKLTDALGGIRKTTGLTTEEVKELSKEIDSIDTRTSQEALHQLAYEAGKLGIEGVENIMQFVRAGNIIKVALGDDLGEDAIMKLMKLNNVMGLTTTMGLEKSLLATGSALNELAAKSEASGDYMIDFASRVAPVARTLGWTADQVLALGATMEAMGQNAEMSATSTSKILMNLEANALAVSTTLKVNYTEFVDLIRTKPVEAFRLMAQKAKEAGDEVGRANFVKIFTKDLGSDEATRMIQVLNAMIDGQDKLTYNLFHGGGAIKKATSATEEYTIMNETAAAMVDRMNESIKKFFVNASNSTGGIGVVVKYLAEAVKWLFDTKIGIELLAVAVSGASIAWVAFKIRTDLAGWSIKKMKEEVLTLAKVIKFLTTKMGGWITIGIGVAVAAYGLYKSFSKLSASKERAADASKKFHESVGKEITELNKAFGPLKKLKEGTAEYNSERTRVIDKYSEMLGFQREEISNLTKQADLYNTLRKRIIEKGMEDAMAAKQTEANKDYWDNYGKKLEFIDKKLRELLPDSVLKERMSKIRDIIQDGTSFSGLLDDMTFSNNIETKMIINNHIAELQISYIKLQKEMQKIENLYSSSRTVEQDWKNEYNTIEKALQKYAELKKKITDIQSNPDKKDPAVLNIDVDKIKKEIQDLETFMGNVFGWKIPDKENEGESKKYIETALAEIKAFYEKREAVIRKQNLLGNISQEEMDRQMENNEMEHLQSRITLLSEFTDMDTSTNAEWLKDRNIISDEAYKEMKGFTIKSRKEREKYIANLEEDKNRELAILKKRTDAIRKLIEESDPILKRQRELSSDLQVAFGDKLFSGDKKTDDERVKQLDTFGRAMTIRTVSQQKEWLDKNTEYGEMLNKLTQKEYDALLFILKKHNVEYEKIINESNFLRKMQQELQLNISKVFGDALFSQDKSENEKRLTLLEEIGIARSDLNNENFNTWIEKHKEHNELLKSLDAESQTALLLMLRKYNEDVNSEIERSYNKQLESSKEYRDLMIRQKALKDQEKTVTGRKGNDFNLEGSKLGIQTEYTAAFIALKREEMAAEDAEFQKAMETLNTKSLSEEDYLSKKTKLEQIHGENARRINGEIEDSEVKLAMSQVSLMEKRAQDLGKFTSIMGNYFGEMAAARKIDDPEERAKAEKEAEQDMVKNMLKTTIQMITEFATRATMKIMFDSLMSASGKAAAVSDVTTESVASGAKMTLFGALGFGKEVSTKGWIGLATGAAVLAAIIGLSSWAMSSVDGMFPEAKTPSVSKAPDVKKKLAPGMLTYADGNVDQVLGSDGISYSAKHQKQFATGVYDKPHYGIVGEAGPELIISSPATKVIMRDYPGIANAIKTISENGSLPQYRTYAVGNEKELLKNYQQEKPTQQVFVNSESEQTNRLLIQTITELKQQLAKPILATVPKYGKGSIDEASRDINAFNARNRRG